MLSLSSTTDPTIRVHLIQRKGTMTDTTTEPDGYYGDDDSSDEELDLSFLDDDEE